MIAGEFEVFVGQNDPFLGREDSFWNRNRSEAEQAQRRAKRQEAANWVRSTVDKNGGIEGLTQTVGNLASLIKRSEGAGAELPADYDTPNDYAVQYGTPPQKESALLKYAPYLIGGALLIGLGAMWLRRSNKMAVVSTPTPASP